VAKRASRRWQGWRTSESGNELKRNKSKTCPNCHRPFRPRKQKHRFCDSCVTKRRTERALEARAKRGKKPALAPVNTLTKLEKRQQRRVAQRRAESDATRGQRG
jgi:protein-arginine kinase activator protein McsA